MLVKGSGSSKYKIIQLILRIAGAKSGICWIQESTFVRAHFQIMHYDLRQF